MSAIIWSSDKLSLWQKLELTLRLYSSNLGAVIIIIISLMQLPCTHLYSAVTNISVYILFQVMLAGIAILSLVIYYGTAVLLPGLHEKRKLWLIPLAILFGIGLAPSNSVAAIEAFLGVKSGFARTPKYGANDVCRPITHRMQGEGGGTKLLFIFELLLTLYLLITVLYAVFNSIYMLIPFLVVLLAGNSYILSIEILTKSSKAFGYR